MKRREFITLLGGAAVWPLVARAQPSERVRRIGALIGAPESDPESQARVAAFREGLEQRGWSEGRNLRVDYRWAGIDPGRIRGFAAELVATAPEVIFAHSTPVTSGLLQATRNIPIVFASVSDRSRCSRSRSGRGCGRHRTRTGVTRRRGQRRADRQLRHLRRRQPRGHHRGGGAPARARDLPVRLLPSRRRSGRLRHRCQGLVPARGVLRRSCPARREAGQPAGAGAGEVRARRQPEDRPRRIS
jgi:ABC transporter substrate binding protein